MTTPAVPDTEHVDAALGRAMVGLLGATHLSRPDDVTAELVTHVRELGVESLVCYLIDHEHAVLVPVPGPGSADRSVLRVEGTVGGRAYVTVELQDVEAGPGLRRLWVPLLDGTERMGVLEMAVRSDGPVPKALGTALERFAHLTAQLVMSKNFYGDVFERVRRRRPMTVAAELQWHLLPPLVFATSGLVLSAMLEPAYDMGGDSFDYAVNGAVAHLAVFDAMGHGLPAATAVQLAVAAYRNARRRDLDLTSTYAAIDDTLLAEFGGQRYATAVLARLNLDTGRLTWINAGHPPPLLLRDGRLLRELALSPATPMGLSLSKEPPEIGEEALSPGDRLLLYTDGLTEARTADGSFFTVERLGQFLERQSSPGLPVPETLRRLRHAIMAYQQNRLQDDATAMLVEWRGGSEVELVPDSVLS